MKSLLFPDPKSTPKKSMAEAFSKFRLCHRQDGFEDKYKLVAMQVVASISGAEGHRQRRDTSLWAPFHVQTCCAVFGYKYRLIAELSLPSHHNTRPEINQSIKIHPFSTKIHIRREAHLN